MSYGFDLARLPAGVDRQKTDKQKLEGMKNVSELTPGTDELGPVDPQKEQLKRQLAAALIARHPTLELYRRDYLGIAKARGIDEAEARRLFRTMELNDKTTRIQILLFDDEAGASFAFTGDPQACSHALRVLWDCLKVLESEGGFSTYDTQIDKVLDLQSDFETVLKYACGVDCKKA